MGLLGAVALRDATGVEGSLFRRRGDVSRPPAAGDRLPGRRNADGRRSGSDTVRAVYARFCGTGMSFREGEKEGSLP